MEKTQSKNQVRVHQLRKKPKQLRSKILFDKILLVAKQLFEEKGYANVSTNQIAEASNISIGSIYQYFPNCEAIAVAIYEESATRATRLATRTSLETDLPLDRAIPMFQKTLLDIFKADRYALLRLIDEVPELRNVTRAMSFENLIRRTTQTYLETHFPNALPREIRRKVYMIDNFSVGIIKSHLIDKPGDLTDKEFVAEVSAMILLYLKATLPTEKSKSTSRSSSFAESS